jgi:hypothetical protein
MRQFHAGVSRHVACSHHTLIHFMGFGQNCLVTRLLRKSQEWFLKNQQNDHSLWVDVQFQHVKVGRSCLDTAYFRIQRTRVFFFPWLGGSSSAYLGPWWSLVGAAKIPCSTSLGVLGAWHDRWTGRLLELAHCVYLFSNLWQVWFCAHHRTRSDYEPWIAT